MSKKSLCVSLFTILLLIRAEIAFSALRDLRVEFHDALFKLDVEKVQSLLREGFVANDGVSSTYSKAEEISRIIREEGRNERTIELENRCIAIMEALAKAGGFFTEVDNYGFNLTLPLLKAVLDNAIVIGITKDVDDGILSMSMINIEGLVGELITQEIRQERQKLGMVVMIQNFSSQVPMLFTRKEVIDRLEFFQQYKKGSDAYTLERFAGGFWEIIEEQMVSKDSYSSDDDMAFASEVIKILRSSGAEATPNLIYFFQSKRNEYRNVPDMIREIDKYQSMLE